MTETKTVKRVEVRLNDQAQTMLWAVEPKKAVYVDHSQFFLLELADGTTFDVPANRIVYVKTEHLEVKSDGTDKG